MYCLLRFALQTCELLLHFPFQVPVRPLGGNIKQVLRSMSDTLATYSSGVLTKSCALRCWSSSIMASAMPSTFFSTVSSMCSSSSRVCFFNVRLCGSNVLCLITDSATSLTTEWRLAWRTPRHVYTPFLHGLAGFPLTKGDEPCLSGFRRVCEGHLGRNAVSRRARVGTNPKPNLLDCRAAPVLAVPRSEGMAD